MKRQNPLCRSLSKGQSGAILLFLLFMVTLTGLMIGIAGYSWKTLVQRAKEDDLLWKGGRIRTAIGAYYETAQTAGKAVKQYPRSLHDLLLDPRYLEPTRYLRKLYPDPMTGLSWETIPAPGGGIMGVRSSARQRPFKQAGFTEVNRSFAGQQSYRSWMFVYHPVGNNQPVPAGGSGTSSE